MPAQSPTLSPTLSAITAGLRGSSSGMPASTLPTRSAPTSAPLVKMPPPRRAKTLMSLPPKARPTSASIASLSASGRAQDQDLVAGHAESAEADHQEPGDRAALEGDAERVAARRLAASAVRTFVRTETFMPMKPAAAEPRRRSGSRSPPGRRATIAEQPMRTKATAADDRVLAVEVGRAPSWTAAAISRIRSLPGGLLEQVAVGEAP